ncbi:hypothetical protein HPP92_003630 [Vanilla planifolia]|uniref:Malate dehydrogenase n=1 Tax=Vanilla planifolia TaxID=51239 RepID=A0A835VNN9_VANPL|nr:hypothetical protein HPP92_003630 [Vanilla planifolia]
MTRDDLFNINAGIVKSLATAIAKYCPNALVNMISNPVNSTVPIAAEVFKKAGTFDEKKLFGVTTLDVVRAKTFYAAKAKVPVEGNSAKQFFCRMKILRLLQRGLRMEELRLLKLRQGKVLQLYPWRAVFADACLKGLNGVSDIVECSFVQSNVTELPFFASKVRLGKNGVEEVLGLGPLSDFEKQGLENLKPELKASIEKGIKFAREN